MSTAAELTLPEGTITMLFSDIEGSTVLLQRLGASYRDVLSQQQRIMRAAIQEHGGHEMGTEGDSFYVVFSSATAAVRAAVEAQRALLGVAVGGGRLRVRMGLHTGEPDRHEGGYVGLEVHQAARVAAAANGGQIVLTEATWSLADGHVTETVRDLGWHRLKDIQEPVHLLRLVVPDLVDEDQPVRTIGVAASLPHPATSFVAREELIAHVDARLRDTSIRFITLVGPGGVGKTRLAIAIAERSAAWVRDGVFFVGLSEVRTNEDVWAAIADTIGVSATDREPTALLAWLRDRSVLLVLDNLEQLPQVHQVVARLVAETVTPELLVTSRRPVHVSAEHLVPVPPLDLSDAVELFLQRLAAVRPGDPGDLAVVRELCERVDGIPLAIELLAARGQLLSPAAMLEQFTDGLDLRSRTVDLPARQRSLTAVLDWSHDLLAPAAVTGFRRLGAISGTFGVAAAAAALDMSETEALDVLLDLVEASLLMSVEAPGGAPEFLMLRVVDTYASHLLEQDQDELAATRSRLTAYVQEWAAETSGELRSQTHLAARDRIDRRQQLIRRVLADALAPGSPDAVLGVQLAADLTTYWYLCGYETEGGRWLSLAAQAAERLDDALEGTDRVAVNRALHGLAIILLQQGRLAEGEVLLRRCLAAWLAAGDLERASVELNSLALARRAQGDAAEAGELFREAIELARASGEAGLQINAMSNLALLELDRGSPAEALPLLREVLVLDTRAGDPWGISADHVNIATALVLAGETAEARAVLMEHGPTGLELGDSDLAVEIVENLAFVCAAEGRDEVAAAMFGAARNAREAARLPRVGPDLDRLDALLAPARTRLGARWESAVAAGSGLSLTEAFSVGVDADGLDDRGRSG